MNPDAYDGYRAEREQVGVRARNPSCLARTARKGPSVGLCTLFCRPYLPHCSTAAAGGAGRWRRCLVRCARGPLAGWLRPRARSSPPCLLLQLLEALGVEGAHPIVLAGGGAPSRVPAPGRPPPLSVPLPAPLSSPCSARTAVAPQLACRLAALHTSLPSPLLFCTRQPQCVVPRAARRRWSAVSAACLSACLPAAAAALLTRLHDGTLRESKLSRCLAQP